jgi:ubiquinone/menaquinone biosynthesis C-methylase UbiE
LILEGSYVAQDDVFGDENSARQYAAKHQKSAQNFGVEYAGKLKARGFNTGKILDVGCGFGGTLRVLARNFPQADCTGIDLSEPLLELARQTAVTQGLQERVRFEQADAQAVPYPDDSFDVVISTGVVHHVADPVAMLKEIARVLAPEGMLYIADIRRSMLAGLFDDAARRALSYDEVLKLLWEARFPKEPFTSGFLWWRYER